MDRKNIVQIKRLYLNPKIRGSFSGAENFYQCHKEKFNKEEVKHALEEIPVYTQNKTVQRRFPRRTVYVHGIDEQWAIDLIEIHKWSKHNNNYKYLLTCIDVFSKYAWVTALKDKYSTTTLKAMEAIFKKSGRQPKMIQCDKGREFMGSFKKRMNELGINIFHVQSELKCCVVERFNRTILDRISKIVQHKNTKKFIDLIPSILSNYNKSFHRSIKTAPSLVTSENEMETWLNLYGNKELKAKSRPKFSVGDRVLISIDKRTFEKGYSKRFQDEIFVIIRIGTSEPRMYYIKSEETGEEIEGGFYAQELSRVRYRV